MSAYLAEMLIEKHMNNLIDELGGLVRDGNVDAPVAENLMDEYGLGDLWRDR